MHSSVVFSNTYHMVLFLQRLHVLFTFLIYFVSKIFLYCYAYLALNY
jgi:hypothetical protein